VSHSSVWGTTRKC